MRCEFREESKQKENDDLQDLGISVDPKKKRISKEKEKRKKWKSKDSKNIAHGKVDYHRHYQREALKMNSVKELCESKEKMPTKVAPQTDLSIFIYLFCGRNSSFYFPMCHRLSNCRLSEETLRSELQIFLSPSQYSFSRENRNKPRTTTVSKRWWWWFDWKGRVGDRWYIMSSLSHSHLDERRDMKIIWGARSWESEAKKMCLTHLSVHCRSLFCLLVINAL